MAETKARLAGIDSFRYLLCFPVALLHALPGTAGRTTLLWASLAACACRVAVPFFFIASGFFMRVPERWTARIVGRPLARLLPLYVAWFLIYAGLAAIATGHVEGLSVRGLVTGGTAFHLWFIPVLGVALAALPVAILLVGVRITAAAAAAIALLGLALGAYRDVLHLREVGGIRLTMAPALVLIGYAIARGGVRIGRGAAALGVAICFLLVLGEEALIARLSGTGFTSHDIVLSTYPLGAALFLFALALPPARTLDRLAALGRISLGVYAAHLIFVRLLAPSIGQATPAQALTLAIAATLAATLLSALLDRLPLARRLVR